MPQDDESLIPALVSLNLHAPNLLVPRYPSQGGSHSDAAAAGTCALGSRMGSGVYRFTVRRRFWTLLPLSSKAVLRMALALRCTSALVEDALGGSAG